MNANRQFEDIWAEWLSQSNLQTRIDEHLKGRQQFLRFVERSISNIVRKVEDESSHRRLRVLEVGCGTAIDSFYLAERVQADLCASDLTVQALQVAQKIQNGFSTAVKLVAADLMFLPFDTGSFDLVFSQGVLEHFYDPSVAVKEQARVTKPGGYVIIDVPQTWNPYTLYKKYRLWRGDWPYGWETQYTLSALKKVAENQGLRFNTVDAWGDTFGFRFGNKAPSLRFLDSIIAGYFKAMNASFGRWSHYYRQSISVCFSRVG